MKFGNMFKSGLAVVAVAMAASAAHATPQYFFGNLPSAGGVFPVSPTSPPRQSQTDFLAAVDVTGTQTSETSAVGQLCCSGPYNFTNQMPVFSGGTLSQAPLDPNSSRTYRGAEVKSGLQAFGRFNTTGGTPSGRWIESDWSFTIDIGQDVGAFGFYGTDFADFLGNLVIELYDGNTRIEDNAFTDASGTPLQPRTASAGSQNGSLLFFGYASATAFDRIVFNIGQQATGPLDTLGFDDIMVGNLKTVTNPAPEPGSLALAGLALFAAGWARKTQRRA